MYFYAFILYSTNTLNRIDDSIAAKMDNPSIQVMREEEIPRYFRKIGPKCSLNIKVIAGESFGKLSTKLAASTAVQMLDIEIIYTDKDGSEDAIFEWVCCFVIIMVYITSHSMVVMLMCVWHS